MFVNPEFKTFNEMFPNMINKVNEFKITQEELNTMKYMYCCPAEIMTGFYMGRILGNEIEKDWYAYKFQEIRHTVKEIINNPKLLGWEGFFEYGSCDSPEQLRKHLDPLGKSEHEYMVVMHPVSKETSGDYRFHKNGGYVGDKREGYEHLKDEPNIDNIWQYHIYKKRK